MNILVTGTRAPASMDIIRSLVGQRYQVYSADSMRYPLGRYVKGVKNHFTLPKPNRSLAPFIEMIKKLVIEYKIDLLIPTCEEIFFISKGYDELSKYTRLWCEPFDRLNHLHNKYTFNQLVLNFGLKAPESWLLMSDKDKQIVPQNEDIVLKPVYSRFGSHVIIKPGHKIYDLALDVPYIAQSFVTGKEYCTYAIAHQGKVLIQVCYHPKYTAGPAAGIYFEPATIQPLNHFVEEFCKNYQFSGQIAFDFILKENQAFVLECNPRITSGFHFISEHINWNMILNGQPQSYSCPTQPYMLGLGMKAYGFKHFIRNPKQFIADYKNARDVLNRKFYPGVQIKSLLTIINIFIRMIKERKGFHKASTDDIEFNGACN